VWEESFLDIDGAFGPLAEGQRLLDRRQPVTTPPPAALAPLTHLITAIDDGSLADALEAQWRLLGILMVLARARPSGDGDGDAAALERGRRALAEHPERPFDLRRAAAAAGLGWELFRKRFRAHYGVAPGHYRLRLRCEAAAQRLLARGATVEGAASDTGFCDGAHLRKHFRAVIGMTPEAFRRAHGAQR
jgi:AraC-like DNA-binding protein